MPGGGAVSRTVAVVAQERTPALHTHGHEGANGIAASLRPGRVIDHAAAGALAVEVALRPIPHLTNSTSPGFQVLSNHSCSGPYRRSITL